MVFIILKAKAESEGVSKITPPASWCVTVKQGSGEETRGPVFISPDNVEEISGSRGTANFQIKWDGAKSASHINIMESKDVTGVIEEGDEMQGLVAFDCRGAEPVEWHLGEGFTVESSSGTVFENVDLSEGDWYEYDEANDEQVGISNISWEFQVFHKKK